MKWVFLLLFFSPLSGEVYRNNLNNREFGKEAPQNLDSERATIAERQGASENPNCEAKPTQPKTDSSSCFGIYSFSNDPIDVVIPCVEKDLITLNLCIEGIRANGANIQRIIVISKKQLTNEAEWFDESKYPFSFQDVSAALAEGGSRTGWYYQQLLKLYAPFVIPGISPNVLALDADTIFLNPVSFLNEQNGGMYNPGFEHHPPYFEHGARILSGFYKYFPDYSGISHHMLFQKPVLEALFEEVETQYQNPFWKTFCLLVDPKELIESGASEYEIYFNYAFIRTDQISVRLLKWRNIEALSEVEDLKNKGFHYVSFHSYNRRD